MRDPRYTSVCDRCYQQTWYTTDPCRTYDPEPRRWHGDDPACRTCGFRTARHYSTASEWPTDGKHGCGGTLRMIDRSDLAPAFEPYYESGQRVRVDFVTLDGTEVYETLTGTIGKTTGWKPAYVLMRTSRSLGSPYLLSARDRITAVKRGRTYVPLG